MVLTFRNLHNWLKAGLLMDVFRKSYDVLKPGGIFGVGSNGYILAIIAMQKMLDNANR